MMLRRVKTTRLWGGLAGVSAGLGFAAVAQAQASGTDCPDDGMGWWIIFPILFGAFMLIAMFRMLAGDSPLRMMGMMGGTRGRDQHGVDGGSGRSDGDRDALTETPLEAAQRRYANGEISREEFQRLRDDLG